VALLKHFSFIKFYDIFLMTMLELSKIKKIKLTTEIAKAVKDFIKKNQLKKGAKLPSERVLTEQLGVGRSSLREALKTLEALDLIEIIPGKGIFIAMDDANIDSLDITNSKKITLLELLQIRELLECYSAKMAAVNATDKQLKKIESKLKFLEDLYPLRIESRKEDMIFHQAIHEASGNPLLPVLFKTIYKLWISYDFGKENAFLETIPFHRPIFESICKHDAKKSVKAVRKMLKITKKTILAQKKKRIKLSHKEIHD